MNFPGVILLQAKFFLLELENLEFHVQSADLNSVGLLENSSYIQYQLFSGHF